jgi:N-acetyltransferase 10
MDDSLNVLPISTSVATISPVDLSKPRDTPEDLELKNLKASLQDTQPVGVLINCCKTVDQVRN